MTLPSKLLNTSSQIAVSILSVTLYFVCSVFFPSDLIESYKAIPFAIALFFAWIFQEAEPAFSRKFVGVTFLNGFIIFAGAFGFSFIMPKAEKVTKTIVQEYHTKRSSPDGEAAAIANTGPDRTFFKTWK